MKGERQVICCLTLLLCFFENRKGIRKCVEFDKCKFVGFYFIGYFFEKCSKFQGDLDLSFRVTFSKI